MEHQNFILKWHYHSKTLAYNLPRFLDAELLTDATLSAEGKNIKVHRLILASCSSYFFQLFQNTPSNQQPIVVLHNIKYEDLKAIISYVYYGQCLVSGSQIPRLISVAEFLKIQGLSDMKFPDLNSCSYEQTNFEGNNNVVKPLENDFTEHKDNCSSSSKCDLSASKCDLSKVDIEWSDEDDDVGDSPKTEHHANSFQTDDSYKKDIMQDVKLEITPSFKREVKSASPTNNSSKKLSKEMIYRCEYCGKTLSNQYNLKVHVETHQEGYHACQSCSHVSRSRDALRKHVSYRHPHQCMLKKKRKLENS